jgi:zinc-ribbon family
MGANLLIIWGFRVFFHTIGAGAFHCPRCGGDRQYRRRAGRYFFTLFFIPVIPLKRTGEDVQCATCRTRFAPSVLSVPTTAQMSAVLPEGMRTGAVTMLLCGDPLAASARQRALEAIRGAGANPYGPGNLEADLRQPPSLENAALAQVGMQLTPEAREWFLAEVVRIGIADGPLTERERQAAQAIAQYLGMTPAQTYGVVAMTAQAARPE